MENTTEEQPMPHRRRGKKPLGEDIKSAVRELLRDDKLTYQVIADNIGISVGSVSKISREAKA